jgi:class 3 adenylate cyclase
MSIETRHVKYIFADIVGFTERRTVDAQVEIISGLNDAFRSGLEGTEAIFLPTGDGICAGIIASKAPADAHLQGALRVLNFMHEWSGDQVRLDRCCELRVGINESVDVIITDINGRRNIAGNGINQAQRLMSMADGRQIIAGRAAYETLSSRDAYADAFREVRAETKRGAVLTGYQYISAGIDYLDTKVPWSVQNSDPKDIELTEALEKHFGKGSQVSYTIEAMEKWREEMGSIIAALEKRCSDDQRAALRRSQEHWHSFFAAEKDLLDALGRIGGTMHRVLKASYRLDLVRERVKGLRTYSDEFLDYRTDAIQRE